MVMGVGLGLGLGGGDGGRRGEADNAGIPFIPSITIQESERRRQPKLTTPPP